MKPSTVRQKKFSGNSAMSLQTHNKNGRFHITMTFLAVIGKKYEESGLEDMLIESRYYGSNSVVRLLHGKAYNKGVRAHKLLLEALKRIQW